ncbi:MAG: hypothetical protein EOP38_11425 [Rubrivivax sp.]|nr:MAG: hypothetical protein EOP38_11425 [Rubrivivax sp.]
MSAPADDQLALLKAGLLRVRRQPMNFAVGLGKLPEEHQFRLHATRAGRALAKEIKDASQLKQLTWGTARMDEAASNTLTLSLEDRPLGGLKKKLEQWLKLQGMPVRKVAVLVGGREVSDTDEADGGNEAAGMPDASGTSTAAATPPAASQAAPLLAKLKASLKLLIPAAQALIQSEPGTAAELKTALLTCQRHLQAGDAGAAEVAVKLLARRLQSLRAEADARFKTTVSDLEPVLIAAANRLRTLQSDPEVQKDRKALAETGASIVNAVVEARRAAKAGDHAKAKALEAKARQERLKAQKLLAPYWPKGKSNPDADWAPVVARLDVSCPKDGTVFWSGDKFNAMDMASDQGGASLECTQGGAMIDNWNENNVPWSEREGDGPPFLRDLWQLVSASFALQAQGRITVVQTPEKALTGGGEIWKRVERHILRQKMLMGEVTLTAPIVKPAADTPPT